MSTISTHCGESLLAYGVGCGSAQYIPPHHIEGVDWQKSYTFASHASYQSHLSMYVCLSEAKTHRSHRGRSMAWSFNLPLDAILPIA